VGFKSLYMAIEPRSRVLELLLVQVVRSVISFPLLGLAEDRKSVFFGVIHPQPPEENSQRLSASFNYSSVPQLWRIAYLSIIWVSTSTVAWNTGSELGWDTRNL